MQNKWEGFQLNKIFILEDDYERILWFREQWAGHCELTIATCIDSAIKAYTGVYDGLFLDHDLGGNQMVDSIETNTGYTFCKWIIKNTETNKKIPIVVHSMNPVGADKMLEILTDNKFIEVLKISYPNLKTHWYSNQIGVGGKYFREVNKKNK